MSTTDTKPEYADQPAPAYNRESAAIHDSNLGRARRRGLAKRLLRMFLSAFLALFILDTFTRLLAYPKQLWNQMASVEYIHSADRTKLT